MYDLEMDRLMEQEFDAIFLRSRTLSIVQWLFVCVYLYFIVSSFLFFVGLVGFVGLYNWVLSYSKVQVMHGK